MAIFFLISIAKWLPCCTAKRVGAYRCIVVKDKSYIFIGSSRYFRESERNKRTRACPRVATRRNVTGKMEKERAWIHLFPDATGWRAGVVKSRPASRPASTLDCIIVRW